MSTTLGESLSRAYQHIEADEHSEALQILEPLLETDSDNADVWWIYAHATDDIEEARRAVNRVIRLRPDYPGAEQLLDQIHAETDALEATGEDVFERDDDFDLDFEDEFEDLEAESTAEVPAVRRETRSRRRLLFPLALLALLLVVIVLGVLLLGGRDDEPPATTAAQVATARPTEPGLIPTVDSTAELEPTQDEIIFPTVEATEEQAVTIPVEPTTAIIPDVTEVVPTDSIPTEEPSPVPTEFNVATVFGAFSLPANPENVIISDLGRTYLVTVCSDQTQSPRETLNSAMATLAEVTASVPQAVDAMAVELTNCAIGQTINMIGVPFTMARDFFEGTLSASDYVRQWRVIQRRS